MSPKKKETPKSFEENITRLEEIVALLERGDAPLADSLALFEEGTRLSVLCAGLLDEAEQMVVKLQKGPGGEPVELPFDTEE
ncbi:MAG: exodeoxyribonuclease VII small subunit [Oscillospiraceae bacterium]|nr:exodeoxyribonuclease VII small subunit [Oscillospiraceae bacterium]